MGVDVRSMRLTLAHCGQALWCLGERERAVAEHAEDGQCKPGRERSSVHLVGKDRGVDVDAFLLEERS